MKSNFLSDEIFLVITSFGNPVFYGLFILALIIFNVSLAWPLLLALLLTELLCIIIKLLYRKDRPIAQSREGIFNKIDANSFPSVHSARAALMAVMIMWYIKNPAISVLAIALMLAIGYSRIYFKRHHLVDVVAGFLLGIGIAIMTIKVWNL